MHLTCTNLPPARIEEALESAKAAGIQNILALRGDPPHGQERWTAVDGGFSHAVDLVRFIRARYGDYFCIGVAGYPEGHAETAGDMDLDIAHLRGKVEAGADYVVTQLFYCVPTYLAWVERVRAAGVTVPILPGIMPIQNYGGFRRMTTLCQTRVPAHILEALEPIKDDDKAVREYGVQLAIAMCEEMRAAGQQGFHFYTLNLERSTRLILEGLGFVAPAKPLPWSQSLVGKRAEQERVRPIFWSNRKRSYIQRTEAWDEWPNGRWGDSRSPAFGDLDGWGVTLKAPTPELRQAWGEPAAEADLVSIFSGYVQGSVPSIPWCDSGLASGGLRCLAQRGPPRSSRASLTRHLIPPTN
jgi:methylenetetrahydrofolate reductase (NADPH)